MNSSQKTIDWAEVHDRLKKSQLALRQVSSPDPEAIQALYRRRAAQLAGRRSRDTATTLPVLAFWLGQERYGIRLRDLAEVVPFTGCTPLPGAPPELAGAVNLRGEIHLVVDLARLLELPGGATDAPGHILFLRRESRKIGMKVDRADQIHPVSADELAAPEDKRQHLSTRYVKGIMPDGLIVIDLEVLWSHPVFKESDKP